ncbi:uncharacterized protein DS421_3g83970 [Arachis hypogaea]|nr:uncharacterized protein DS421_3g83970 [Arachis hypogaea]
MEQRRRCTPPSIGVGERQDMAEAPTTATHDHPLPHVALRFDLSLFPLFAVHGIGEGGFYGDSAGRVSGGSRPAWTAEAARRSELPSVTPAVLAAMRRQWWRPGRGAMSFPPPLLIRHSAPLSLFHFHWRGVCVFCYAEGG